MAKIPMFETLDEAAEFWDTHEFEDYVDDTEPVTTGVRIDRRKHVLTVALPLRLYEQIEALASRRGLRMEQIVSSWLAEKLSEDAATP